MAVISRADGRLHPAGTKPILFTIINATMKTTHEGPMPATQELVTPEEVYVINLRRSSERWARFNAFARRHNASFRRFEATDAHCLRYEEHDNDTLVVTVLNDISVIFHVHRDALTRRIINLADIACAISHARLWTAFLRSGNAFLAVLEDDALVQRPLEFHPLPEDADIVFFGSRVDAFMPSDDETETPSEEWFQENKFAKVANVRGMEGYLLRRAGASKMLHALRTMRLPLDVQVTLDCCEAPPCSDSDLSRPSLQSPGISAYVTTEVFAIHNDSALNLTSENRGVRRLRWKSHARSPLNATDSREDTRSGGIQSLNPEPSTGSSEFTGSAVISGLWIGKELPPIARLSIMSYQAAGYPFRLFTYDEVKGVPKNTIVADASVIMPYKELLLQPGDGDAHASELFRYILLEEQGGCWTDLDVICLKERPSHSEPWFALQNQTQADSGFLEFSLKHPVIACMADCAFDPGRRTPWDDIETIGAKIKDCYRHPTLRERREAARRARWAHGGTDEFTRCLKFHCLFSAAAPSESLYPVHGTEWKRLYDGTLGLGDVAGESTWGIHLWGEKLRNEPHVLQTMDDSSVVAALVRRFTGIPARDWLQRGGTGLKNKSGSPARRNASGRKEKLSNKKHHSCGGRREHRGKWAV